MAILFMFPVSKNIFSIFLAIYFSMYVLAKEFKTAQEKFMEKQTLQKEFSCTGPNGTFRGLIEIDIKHRVLNEAPEDLGERVEKIFSHRICAYIDGRGFIADAESTSESKIFKLIEEYEEIVLSNIYSKANKKSAPDMSSFLLEKGFIIKTAQ